MNPRRIMLSLNRLEWWSATGDFAARPGRLVNAQGRCFAVDPATTSPNVLVGIAAEPGAEPVYLRPGEMVTFSQEVRQVYVFNPLIRQCQVDRLVATFYPLGMVGLLVGDQRDLVAWQSRAGRTRPSPVASLIAAAPISSPVPDATSSLHVPCNGLEKLSLKVYPITAGQAWATPPADLAAVVRVIRQCRVPNASTIPTQGAWAGVDPDTGDWAYNTADYGALMIPDALSDFTVSQTQLVMEYEVGGADLCLFNVQSFAGTGVVGLWGWVTGM
jgi:hypothetical protein